MRIPLFLCFIASILCVHIEGAVAPSPFLPPGYNSRPPQKPIQSPRKPKPQTPNVQISKEIEFGGFFSLGTGESRKLYFSLFNKKVNHSQWITIGEKTDEDFLAESFDFDTETLTVRFGDSSHDLSLRMSKGTSGGKSGSSNARNVATTTASTPGKPRVMPPRPKTTPTLPPWLANRSASGSSRTGGGYSVPPSRGGTSGPSSASASQPMRTLSGGHSGGYVPRPLNSVNSPVVSSPSTGVSSPSRNPSYTGSTSAPNDIGATTPSTNPSSPSTSAGGGNSESGSVGTVGVTTGSEIDLNNLPPPPPPLPIFFLRDLLPTLFRPVRISYATVLGPTLLLLSFVVAQNQRRIGTRHDVSVELHRQMGSNLGSFSSGENFPDLSPVGLVQSGKGFIGTGTLISPTIVVTAGHVLRGSNKAKVPVASEWTFSIGSDSLKPIVVYSVSEVILHPGWTARLRYKGGIGDGDLLGLDLALLRLSLPVIGVDPARFNVGDSEPIGSRVILAGYGSIADGKRGVTSVDNFDRLAGENTLDRVVETVNVSNVPQAYRGGLLGLDFDSPDEFFNALGSQASLIDYLGSGSSASTPLPYEATTAEGDSGGPAFVRMNDVWKVVGTVSYGTESSVYGDVTVYTRLASQADWLQSYLERWAPARRTGFGEWLNLDWLGNFSTSEGDWVFHEKLGWFYSPSSEADEFWAWQTGIGWWWTSIKAYPYFYAHERSRWLYFSVSDSTPSSCRFYDYEIKDWRIFEH